MFGYIRPVKPELKIREFDQFKACYCTLCHALGDGYGPAARFILNYDFVFLAMLLWEPGIPVEYADRSCPACPLRGKRCCRSTAALDICAGYSVILAWWKLCDSVEDEPFIKGLPYRGAKLLLRRAFKKAAAAFPEFDGCVRSGLAELRELESGRSPSLDRAAECFAEILASAAGAAGGEAAGRALRQVLYHTGRWIYIVDACDDLRGDLEAGRYNPIAARFGLREGALTGEVTGYITTTLYHSRNLAGTAFELLPETAWSDIVRNIICLGMPAVSGAVLAGKWKKPRQKAPK